MVRTCRYVMLPKLLIGVLGFLLVEPVPHVVSEVGVSAESSFDSGQAARPGVEVSGGASGGDVKFQAQGT